MWQVNANVANESILLRHLKYSTKKVQTQEQDTFLKTGIFLVICGFFFFFPFIKRKQFQLSSWQQLMELMDNTAITYIVSSFH